MDEENQNAELLRKLSYVALYISHLGVECWRQNILRDKCNRQYADCLNLIGTLVPLFKELEKIKRQISEKTVYALRMFEEALDRAKNLAQLMRCGCKLYMELNREEINNEFKNTSSRLRRALDYFSYGELYIPDLYKVEASLEYFEEMITMFDAPDLKLYEDVSYQSNDVATDNGTISKLCSKLHFYGVEDIKRESQVLKKVMDMKKVMNIPGDGNLEESENKMSVLLEKLGKFLEYLTVPVDLRCPISFQLMRDPVIICTGKTYERASIEEWLNKGKVTCPVTRKNIVGTSVTSNRALQSFISKWDRINGMEPFKKFGNSLSKLTFNHMEQEFGRGVPNEFVCNLSERRQPRNCQKSTKLMKDPVIICTGETFERASIEKWLKAGHTTCPLTGEFLSSTSLTPNHALYSLISNWREVNGLKPFERSISSDQGMVASTDYAQGAWLVILLSKLTSDKPEDRRSAAGELYYLDKDSYSIVIPQLVDLLSSPDTDTKNYAIAILRQLSLGVRDSIHCIISSKPVPGIRKVLENGSMEARRDAALTFWSLSTLNDEPRKTWIRIRKTLGASGTIPALVKLSGDGGPWEKTASARVLSELCKYEGNQGLPISAGVVPMLLRELKEYSRSMESGPYGPICDEALDVMKLLVSHPNGKEAIRDFGPVPVLLFLLIIGSPRNKEIVLAILSQMQSHLALDVSHLPQAKVLKQILLDLNRDDDITSDEAERDFNTLLFPFIPGIVYVLKNGSMKAREGAALTFWSLQTLNDESRKTFGESGAIPALVKLLRVGGPRQKTASARALSKLCKYKGNQGLAISAGVVSLLIGELRKYSRSRKNRLVSGRPPPYGPICDEALDVMKLLVSHPAGKAAIRGWRPVPVLLLLLIIGSPRNKEIVLAILSQMQSDLHLNDRPLPLAEELRQILMDLNRDDDITSDEAEQDFKTLLSPSIPARGGAALTFWSLPTLDDESRKTFGESGAIPALVKLLRDGGLRQKTASARALSELCKYEGNQGLAISAGVVSMLFGELTEYSRSRKDRLVSGRPPPYGPICDEALDVMKLLVSCPDGKVAIRDCGPVPVLLLLLIIGSPRNKEIVLAILSQMQFDLDLNDRPLPLAEELRQILMDLNRDDDITSDEAERDFNTLLFPFIPGIVYVLKNGSMKAREGAALTFWSLQTLNDESRKTFGESGAIPALVKLLRDGGPQQKTASAGALSDLCKYKENQRLAISAGVVSMLFGELREYSRSMESGRTPPYGPICDKALDVMKLLVSHPNGKAAIRDCRPVPVLLSLLKIGSPRNKEIVLAILRQMQSDLDLNDRHLPQAKELVQILMDLKKDDITSDEAWQDLETLFIPTI